MKNNKLLNSFCTLESKFKDIEIKSQTLSKAQEGEYLCIRLDGIGLSKRFLKDAIKTGQFTNIMWQAVEKTYKVLHRRSPTNAQNIFLGVMICSDEVSIILNAQKNYYEGRLFKIVTTISSTFSSFFSISGIQSKHQKKGKKIMGSFDGRPLVLSSTDEAIEYMSYRYGIYIRNATFKLLRLNGLSDEEAYSKENKGNIEYITKKVIEFNLEEDQRSIAKDPVFFIPNKKGDLDSYKYSSLEEFQNAFPKLLESYDSWLTDKCA